MAEVYISFRSPLRSVSRWDIEEDIEELLGTRGFISGGGGALDGAGANIDLHVDTDNRREVAKIVKEVVELLRGLAVPADTDLLVVHGEVEYHSPVYDESFPAPPPSPAPEPRDQEETVGPSPAGLPSVGDAYLVPLPGVGVLTVCRVIRLEPGSTHPVLVAATDWFGQTAPDLTEKRLKKPLDLTYVGGRGGYRSWVVADVPPHFSKLGTVLPSAADKRADSPFHSSWNVFLRTIVSQLKWTQRAHETDGNEPPTSDE